MSSHLGYAGQNDLENKTAFISIWSKIPAPFPLRFNAQTGQLRIAVTGKFDEDFSIDSFDALGIWATRVRCK